MSWEIRDEYEEVVYTHYLDDEEEEKPMKKIWYAVMKDNDDQDWGTGSFDRDEAIEMVRANKDIYPDGYIAVIKETETDSVCVDEIRDI